MSIYIYTVDIHIGTKSNFTYFVMLDVPLVVLNGTPHPSPIVFFIFYLYILKFLYYFISFVVPLLENKSMDGWHMYKPLLS